MKSSRRTVLVVMLVVSTAVGLALSLQRLQRTPSLNSSALVEVAPSTIEPDSPTSTPENTRVGHDSDVWSVDSELAAAEKPLAVGEEHVFSTTLERRDVLHLRVQQEGVDVVLTLTDPEGETLRVDSLNGPKGPEELIQAARVGGGYHLSVSALAGSGSYRLEVLTRGSPTELDRKRLEAFSTFRSAEELRLRGRSDWAEARRQYQMAEQGFQHLEHDLMAARCEGFLGYMALQSGELRSALDHFLRAERLFPEVATDWERAALQNDLGEVYRQLAQVDRAKASFRRAFEIVEKSENGNLLAAAVAFNNLGVLHSSLGQLQEAIAAYQRSSELWQEIGVEDQQAVLAHNIGVYYLELGRSEEGLEFLHRALSLHSRAGSEGGQAAALTAIGSAQHTEGDNLAALHTLTRALSLRDEVGIGAEKATTLDRLGTVYFSLERFEEARESYAAALRLVSGMALDAAYVKVNLGSTLVALGQHRQAIALFREAVLDFRRSGALPGEVTALSALSQALREVGELDEALEASQGGLEIVESIRGRLQSQWLRNAYLAVRHDLYSNQIDLLMTLAELRPDEGFAARAFAVSERARGRGLLESLVEANSRLRTEAPELVREEQRLRLRINSVEQRRIGQELSAEDSVSLDHELTSLLLQYEQVQGELRLHRPDVLAAVPTLGIEQIQQEFLDGDSLLLAYSLGARRSFLWAIDREGFSSHILPARETLEKLAHEVHQALQRHRRQEDSAQETRSKQELASHLLGPIASRLAGQKLMIVGDGALHYVPFAALVVDRRYGKPLLQHHELTYVPSISMLALDRRSPRVSGQPSILVVADPVFEPTDRRVPPAARKSAPPIVRQKRRWERLLGTRAEAELIVELAGGERVQVLMDFAATLDWIKENRLEGFQIVHLATHAFLNDRHPALSGIVLSQVDRYGEPREGFLRMHELFDLRLAADLVVLSGCQTALGEEIRGEGLVGLTQGFFYSGASGVLASLWSIEDAATAEFMGRFYRMLLERRLEPAAALRQAQLAMFDHPTWNDASYWAGFVLLQGEPQKN